MEFENRTETQNISNTDFIILNTGNSRHRGLEAEFSYDLLAPFQHPPMLQVQPEPYKDVLDSSKGRLCPAYTRGLWSIYKLIAFSNVQFLDAEFTESALLMPDTDKTIVGNTPAFAPDILLKGGISFQKRTLFRHSFNSCLRVTAVLAGHQYWEPRDPESQHSCLQDFQSLGGLSPQRGT